MAGLPQGRNLSAASIGERPNTYPIWVKFLKTKFKTFVPIFTFWGQILRHLLSVILKPPCEQEAKPQKML